MDPGRLLEHIGYRQEPVEHVEQTLGICPFRGLEVFREQDRNFFFGRDALIQHLVEHMQTRRFLALLGPSGSGKSSLVQAGLIPWLREQGTLIGSFSPGGDPFEELVFCLRRLFSEVGQDVLPETLGARLEGDPNALQYVILELAELARASRVVLVVDQFEEVFTNSHPDRVKTFLNGFWGALNHTKSVLSLVLTMRTDFLGHCAAHEDLNALISDHCIQVGPMNHASLKQAIIEPCRQVGLKLEQGLIERILDDVTGAPGELPLVEHALLELYDARFKQTLTLQAYSQIGGVEGALTRRADEAYTSLGEDARQILRKMFTLCLVHADEAGGHTRRRATIDELQAIGDPETVDLLIRRWTNARLLVSRYDRERSSVLIDVAHEALIRKWHKITEWMAEDRETAHRIQQLRLQAKTWSEAGGDPDLLPRGGPLQHLEELLVQEGRHLGARERDFITAGLAVRRKKAAQVETERQAELARAQQKTRQALLAAFFFVSLITIFASLMWLKQKEANEQRVAAVQMTGFFKDLLQGMEPAVNGSSRIDIEQVLDIGIDQLEYKQLNPEARAGLVTTIGKVYMSLSRYHKALPLLEEAVDLYRQVRGPDHIQTAISSELLGRLQYQMGSFERSERNLRQALKIGRDLYGENHQVVGDALADLGALYVARGRFREAEAWYRKALALSQQMYGQNHPIIARDLSNLGLLMKKEGRLEEAEPIYRKSLAIRRNIFGNHHADTALALNNLAALLQASGRHHQAEPIYREALAIRQTFFGENHAEVAASFNNLATLLLMQQRYIEAEPLFQRALAIKRKVYGPQHGSTATSLNNLAVLNQARGESGQAEMRYREALAIRRAFYGNQHKKVADSLRRLASFLGEHNRLAEAEAMYREILDILEGIYGDQHASTSTAHAELGRLLHDAGHLEEAEKHLRLAFQIDQKVLPQAHTDLGITLTGLADVTRDLGNAEQAHALISQAIDIFTQTLPSDHWRLDEADNILGATLTTLGQGQKAHDLLLSSLARLAEKLEEDHICVIRARRRVDQIRQAAGAKGDQIKD